MHLADESTAPSVRLAATSPAMFHTHNPTSLDASHSTPHATFDCAGAIPGSSHSSPTRRHPDGIGICDTKPDWQSGADDEWNYDSGALPEPAHWLHSTTATSATATSSSAATLGMDSA